MQASPELFDIPVRGGDLRVAAWGNEGPAVLAFHGITASHLNFRAVATKLPEGVRLVAPDLRGRGGSAGLPGPFGMASHAEDGQAVLDHLGVEQAVVAGMSMGGYVATTLAATHPDRVSEVVLIDGGLPLPIPPGMDPDTLLEATLGPSIERLRMTFASLDAYLDFFREHPSLGEPGAWNEHVEAYLTYDLVGQAPELRSRVSEEAVRADSRDLLANEDVIGALGRVRCPVHLLRATRGVLNEPTPLLPDFLVEEARKLAPGLSEEVVDDTNHFTVVLTDRPAELVARRLLEAVERSTARKGA